MAALKPLVFSYTMLNGYLICPHQFYRRYIKRDLKFVETKEMRYGNEVHSAFEYRVGGKKPLPVAMQQWEPFAAAFDNLPVKVEQYLGMTRDGKPCESRADECFFRGKNDVTVVQQSAAGIFDWKTGKPREESFELETNAMLTFVHNPYLTKIQGSYIWLKENRMGEPHDVSNVNSTFARVSNIAEEIEGCMREDEWYKRRGPLCGWCNVVDCEHRVERK